MGTWSINNFENDDASDWINTLEKSKSLDILLNLLTTSLMKLSIIRGFRTTYC
ncbi:MAG TPA: DUF4259 domain-containing protein [Crenotrichaceae bacterium]|nr:DUF4259 domain-containing protein [Crenotrichaceae bacterium]